jgi:glucokinase
VTPGVGSSAGPAGVAFGVDIGGTKVLGLALNAADELIAEARVPTPTGVSPGDSSGREVAEAIASVVGQLDAAVGSASTPAVLAPPVGVGAPGMLDRQGRLRFSPNLPQAHGIDWRPLIGAHLPGRQVVIENDANFAVLAEHRLGAGRGYEHVVMVTLGTGIGGGFIVDGRAALPLRAARLLGALRLGWWLGPAGPGGRPGREAARRGGPRRR